MALVTAVQSIAATLDPWNQPLLHDEFDIGPSSFVAPRDGWFQITGAERAYRWDIKDGAGLQGAIETYRGRTPPPFQITFYMWTPDHYTAVASLFNSIQYDPTKYTVTPYTISHPVLAILNITQVIVEGIGQIVKVGDWQQGPDMFTAVLKLREFYPPLPFPLQTPNSAAQPEDPAKNQLTDLNNQANALKNQAAQLGSPWGP